MSHTESSIRSYGGNGGLVTGSCHLYERGDNKIGIDYGKFQGKDEKIIEGKPRDLEYVSEICRGTSDFFMTHAHIDHIALFPLIDKYGFTPNIYTTRETFEIAKIMLEDSVKIQEANKKEQVPLYNIENVNNILKRVKIVEPFEEIGIGNRHSKITAILIPNGHMNGSVSVLIKDGFTKKNTLITGDIGRPDQLLCGGYNEYAGRYPDCKIHTILTESTCFENKPVSFNERELNIFNAVTKTTQRGGTIVMPVIAGRLAPTMEIFHNEQESIGQFLNYHFYMDAPLPRKVLKIHQDLGPDFMSNRYGDDPNFYKTRESSMNRFSLKNLTIIESHEQSKLLVNQLAYSSEKAIVFASGEC